MIDDKCPFSPAQDRLGPRVSRSAVTSLVLGLLFFVPISSIASIFFAIKGVQFTRDHRLRGRGLAITGLVLGIIGSLLWIIASVYVSILIIGSREPRASLHDFAIQLNNGSLSAAYAECDSKTVTFSDLSTLRTQLVIKGGVYIDLSCTYVALHTGSGGETCDIFGKIMFSSGPRPFTAVLSRASAG